MAKIVVLGGYGEMGRVVCTDLAETAGNTEIVVAGRVGEKAKAVAHSFKKKNITWAEADLKDRSQMREALEGADVMINATNYYSNLDAMEAALATNTHYVDLGGLYHMTLKQLKLNGQFKRKRLTAIIGCGSTPGITNIMAHYGSLSLDRIETVNVAFADKDYTDYRMPFVVPYSMQTVFDEFTSKPAVFENGRMHFVEPMSGEIEIEFPFPVGTTSCRYSLHSELASMPDTFKDKGVRNCSFRGSWDRDFTEKTKFLITSGFASTEPVKVGRMKVVPREVSVSLLNRFLPPKYVKVDDIELLRVEMIGSRKGRKKTVIMYCKSTTNKKWNIPAGSWDTGVPPSIVAQMLAKRLIHAEGVLPPDMRSVNPAAFFKELEKRGLSVFMESERQV